jgi:hypothetical protein
LKHVKLKDRGHTHTQYEIHKSTKNFHMMTWQKRVNFDTDVKASGMDDSFHLQAGMYLDAKEDATAAHAVKLLTRRLSKGVDKVRRSLSRKVAPAQEIPKNAPAQETPILKATKVDSPTMYLKATNNALDTCYITKESTDNSEEEYTLNVVKADIETIKDRYNFFCSLVKKKIKYKKTKWCR